MTKSDQQSIRRRMLELERERETLEAQLARVLDGVAEPIVSADKGAVVWFVKVYGSVGYTYAAVKAPDGKWHLSGRERNRDRGLTWNELREFAGSTDIWMATEWEKL